jgi:hypothetical protein
MGIKDTAVATLPGPLAGVVADPLSAQIVTLVSLTADGTPEVRLSADDSVQRARLATPATRERLARAVAERQQAVVVFEHGDRTKPLIVGFIEPLTPDAPDPSLTVDGSKTMPVVEADVDGRRVRLTAQDEIVLECGTASITLRRNGRVVIRGTYVETHSHGTNRIKGGQVQIN